MVLERRPNEQQPIDGDAADDDVQETIEVGKMEVKAEFDEVVVWGHERLGKTEDDVFVRGVEEWLAVAEQVSLGAYWNNQDDLLMKMSRSIRIPKQRGKGRNKEPNATELRVMDPLQLIDAGSKTFTGWQFTGKGRSIMNAAAKITSSARRRDQTRREVHVASYMV